MQHNIVQVDEIPPIGKSFLLSLQHLFAMFGATVLVPILLGCDPSIVLFCNGVGTILYLLICKGKIPAYLGASFAFIPPALLILGNNKLLWHAHYQLLLGGFITVGLVFIILAFIIKVVGIKWLNNILSPATIGAITALIGLELAGTAAKMAGFLPDSGGMYNMKYVAVAIVTLLFVMLGSIVFRGFFGVISILIGLVAGYCFSLFLGIVDFTNLTTVSWLTIPQFSSPKFDINVIITIMPAALVVLAEHISHLMVTGNIVGRDLMENPGLHRSLFGNGFSTMLSGFLGSVPTTTYGENIGVLAITRVFSVWVIGGAALFSIILAFVGKIAALIQSIPTPVLGGISMYLFGVIATSGIRMIVESKVDYSKNVNLILTSIVLSVGISGIVVKIGSIYLKGMALATVIGVSINCVIYLLKYMKIINKLD